MFVKIRGVRKYLWRAVDQHGNVLDILIQNKRNGRAATRFFRTLLKYQGHPPRVLITDNLASYQVAHRTTMSATEHRRNKYLNNRCENPPINRPGNVNVR
ncbi:DDE-type integrase/transposase/recombinase [Rhodococcus erythropolis]|uniref:DDE-type integrase/transposase/recombinase n=1 Tax=Rhodococcus erythropolis TaxID=1833 RepID=UPI002949B624|nr:DDE-type integrase/transposase/recombinase [Rhodococcus erythropolis]MDV6278123.1 DDE-type integrase/transposase/recombinase [Rhodococcus erythropolis]